MTTCSFSCMILSIYKIIYLRLYHTKTTYNNSFRGALSLNDTEVIMQNNYYKFNMRLIFIIDKRKNYACIIIVSSFFWHANSSRSFSYEFSATENVRFL